MFRRYWLPVFAVVGLISAAHAQEAHKGHGEAPRAAVTQHAPQPKPQPAISATLQNSLDGIRTALETANQKGETPEEKTKAEEDRQAQLSMARSARQMFLVGIAETAITFCGVLLVLGTLIYTRDAARDAKRSADAAEGALEETRRAANATIGAERDRLRVSRIFLHQGDPRGNTPTPNGLLQLDHICVQFRNGGKSAANVIGISVNRLVCESLPDEPVYAPPVPISPDWQYAGAGDPWEYLSEGQNRALDGIESALADRILTGHDLEYWAYGYIRYVNFVGDIEDEKFCGWLNANKLAIGDPMGPYLVIGGPNSYTGQKGGQRHLEN